MSFFFSEIKVDLIFDFLSKSKFDVPIIFVVLIRHMVTTQMTGIWFWYSFSFPLYKSYSLLTYR